VHMKSTLSAAVSRVCCWSWDRPIHLYVLAALARNSNVAAEHERSPGNRQIRRWCNC